MVIGLPWESVRPEKSKAPGLAVPMPRSASVGTLLRCGLPLPLLVILSRTKKKKSLFLMMGPPTEPPHSLYRRLGLTWPAVLKYGLAFNTSFCQNSYAEPWKVLLPLLLIWLNTAPPIPYCAEKEDVVICTSEMLSKMELSTLPLTGNTTVAPSARKLA